MFELATDHYSPLSKATYDPVSGDLYLEFDYDRLLDTNGEWRNGRHIDAVTFQGQAYPIIIHDDNGPRDANGRYIFNRDTVDNIFTINIGPGHDPADGTLDFGLSDREDGTGQLYSFELEEVANTPVPTPNQGPIAVNDTATTNHNETILVDVLANDSDPDGGALTLTDVITESVSSIIVSIEDGKVKVNPLNANTSARIDTITYTVTDDEGASTQGVLRVDIAAKDAPAHSPTGPTLVKAVNMGGDEFVAGNGVVYEADATNAGRSFSTGAAIAGTTDDGLYQSEAWAKTLNVETAVQNGTYDVELNFAEIWGGAKDVGKRVIDIFVEDELVFDNLDLSDDAGFQTALDLVGQVTVDDGSLSIRAVGDVQNAKLAGFSIWEAEAATAPGFAVGSLYDDLSF